MTTAFEPTFYSPVLVAPDGTRYTRSASGLTPVMWHISDADGNYLRKDIAESDLAANDWFEQAVAVCNAARRADNEKRAQEHADAEAAKQAKRAAQDDKMAAALDAGEALRVSKLYNPGDTLEFGSYRYTVTEGRYAPDGDVFDDQGYRWIVKATRA